MYRNFMNMMAEHDHGVRGVSNQDLGGLHGGDRSRSEGRPTVSDNRHLVGIIPSIYNLL